MNLLKRSWGSQATTAILGHGMYIYYIVNKMKHGDYILVDIEESGVRVWTQNKSKALTFDNIKSAKGYVEKYFTKEQQQTVSIMREG